MKKLLLLFIGIMIATFINAQSTTFKTSLFLDKLGSVPDVLYLRGDGSLIDFYYGDIILRHSSNQLSIEGGNTYLGANSLLLTGSIGATGARSTKGWFTNLEITNYPTIGGTSIASFFLPVGTTLNGYALSGNITLTKSDVGLSNVTNESKTTMFATPPAGSVVDIGTITTIPTIYTGAGDTSLYPIPGKIGNIYINTSGNKVYVSKSAVRGGWLILN